MRRLLIAGNWKMHKTAAEASDYLEGLLAEDLPTAIDVVCCPTFVSLPAAAVLVRGLELRRAINKPLPEDSLLARLHDDLVACGPPHPVQDSEAVHPPARLQGLEHE